MATQQRNQELVSNLTPDFVRHDNIQYQYGDLISRFQALPGLVGLWYPGNVQRSTGNIYDSSGQGRTLTYNGNPTINYLSNGVAYADLDGTGDYFSRADETDLDILGTEAWAANPGLTIIAWVNVADLSSTRTVLSKSNAGGFSYYIEITSTGSVSFRVTDTGALFGSAVNTAAGAIIAGSWTMISAIYVPSTYMNIKVNLVEATNAVGIVASIANTATPLEVGRAFATNLFNGKISIIGLYSCALTPAIRNGLFQQTRNLYGV